MTTPEITNNDQNTPLHELESTSMDEIIPHKAFVTSGGDNEVKITAWAASVRDAFGKNRRQFNFAVCDALATAGVIPTPAGVLRVGKWGHHSCVAADVTQWLQVLIKGFVELQASVPLPAQQLANDLVEKLFALSREESEKTALTQVNELQEKFDVLVKDHELALQREIGLKAALLAKEARLSERLSERDQVIENLQNDLQERKEAMDWAQAKIDRAEALKTAQETAAQERARLREAAVNAAHASALEVQNNFANTLLQVQQAADAERRRLMQRDDDQRVLEQKVVSELKAECAALKARLESALAAIQKINTDLAREIMQRQWITENLANERENWRRERARLESPEVLNKSLAMFVPLEQSLGLTITRDPKVDVAARLQEHIGTSLQTANVMVASIAPKVNVFKKTRSGNDSSDN